MHRQATNLHFNGERDYVHGPNILEIFRQFALDCTGQKDEALEVKKYAIHKMIHQNGELRFFNDLSKQAMDHGALAELKGRIGQSVVAVGLYRSDDRPIHERRLSIEKDLVREVTLASPFAGSAQLWRLDSPYNLIQAIVEANKQLHLSTVSDRVTRRLPKFKFVGCNGLQIPSVLPTDTARIEVSHLGLQSFGQYKFTSNRMELELNGESRAFVIGFASDEIDEFTV